MILVTGATGRIGKELVQQLSSAGKRVRALARDPEKAVVLRNPNVEIAVGDAARPDTLARAMTGIDRMFLLTSADPRQVELQGNLIDAGRRTGVRHVVKLSAFGAGRDSETQIGRWHAETENRIEASGMEWTHLRPHFFMQNLLRFAALVAADHVLAAPLGSAPIAMVDTRDVAAVAAAVLTSAGHEGRAYDLTGPEPVSFAELATKIARVTDKPVTYLDLAPEEARQAMLGDGMPAWLVDELLTHYAGFRTSSGEASTDAVQRLTGYEPRSVDHFIREHAFTFGA
jgi:uncharacterized protein YbjT (DUF2867 family)